MSEGYNCRTCGMGGLKPFVRKCPYCLTDQYVKLAPTPPDFKWPLWAKVIYWIIMIPIIYWFLFEYEIGK
jgi:hypothetical protein